MCKDLFLVALFVVTVRETWLPNELQVSLKLSRLKVVWVDASKYHSLKTHLCKKVRNCIRVAKRIELHANFGLHIELFLYEVVRQFEIA